MSTRTSSLVLAHPNATTEVSTKVFVKIEQIKMIPCATRDRTLISSASTTQVSNCSTSTSARMSSSTQHF